MTIEEEQAAEIERLEADRNLLRAALDAERDRSGIIMQAAQEATNALRAENERMREALRPFVELGLTEAKKEGLWGPKAIVTMYVRYESISNARAALEDVMEKSGDKK